MSVAPPLATIPPAFIMATTETWPLGFDTTNDIGSDESPSDPTFTLTDLNTGQVITLSDEPTIDGNVVTQVVRGSSLTALHQYTLALSFTVNDTTVPSMVLQINYPM